jgi:transcriptional regulator with XRE-family HTH domain
MKQRELAEVAGVPPSTLSRVERGDSIPDAATLRRLGEALGLALPALTEKVEQAVTQAEKTARQVCRQRREKPWWKTVVEEAGKAASSA